MAGTKAGGEYQPTQEHTSVDLDLDAVRHLLRHLNNLPSLRQNVLVAKFFEDDRLTSYALHARVRDIVSNALDLTLAQHGRDDQVRTVRWRAIVLRCDLGGKSLKTVANELGLSERQFFRERSAVHQAMAPHLVRELADLSESEVLLRDVPSPEELEIEYAAALQNVGDFEGVARVLEGLAESSSGVDTRLRAIVELLEIYGRGAGSDTIARLLRQAHAIAQTPASIDQPMLAEMLMIETYAFAPRQGEAYITCIENTLDRLALLSPNRRISELSARAAIALARYALFEDGNMESCGDYLATTKSFLDRTPNPHPALSIAFYEIAGDHARATSGASGAIEAYGNALGIALRQRAPYYIARASAGLASAYCERRDLEQAKLHGRNALVLAERVRWSRGVARTESLFADICLWQGDAQGALTWCERTRSQGGETEGWRSVHALTAAEALEQLGRVDEAVDVIDRYCHDIEREGLLCYLGIGEQIRAKIYARARRFKEARASIGKSIELLERYGMVFQLARAYDVSARLTKNVRHRTRARELSEYLAR
jgi:tetratricopeptide (TPR) repeat protein